jgi:hypothetical protein
METEYIQDATASDLDNYEGPEWDEDSNDDQP